MVCSCTNEKTIKSDKSVRKETANKIVKVDCNSFFKKGDYSDLCFSDSKILRHDAVACIANFITKGDKQEQGLKIQFQETGSAPLAKMHFNLNKVNYKKGKITDVSNLGDAAFFDVHETDLQSLSRSHKDLHVQYMNIFFVIMSDYTSSKEKPCFFNDKELILFANKIIENL